MKAASVREHVCDVLLCKAGLRARVPRAVAKRDYSYVGREAVYGSTWSCPTPLSLGPLTREKAGALQGEASPVGRSVPWQ